MQEHSELLSPSASGLWLECTAMPQALADAVHNGTVKEGQSDDADEGTLKHSYSSMIQQGLIDPSDHTFEAKDLGQWGGNWILEWDEVLKVKEARGKFLAAVSPDSEIHCEFPVGFSGWRSDCFGTADLLCIDKNNRALYVGDDKYGRVRVPAKDNSQMMIYAAAAIDSLKLIDKIDTIRMAIFQPKVSREAITHTITIEELMEWDKTVLTPAQKKILSKKTAFNPGPHCSAKYCELHKANRCPHSYNKIEEIVSEIIDFSTGGLKMNLTSDNLALVNNLMVHADLITKTIKQSFAIATEVAKNGGVVENFKLVKGKGKREWADTEAAEKFLKQRGVPESERYKPRELITAPQGEAVLKANKKFSTRTKNLFEEQIVFKEGGLTLVPADDPREEVKPDTQNKIDEFFDIGAEKEEGIDVDIMSMME